MAEWIRSFYWMAKAFPEPHSTGLLLVFLQHVEIAENDDSTIKLGVTLMGSCEVVVEQLPNAATYYPD
jgi:hypothetical protein